ncbi:hypothetical protein E1B28_010762 [Marasmius oreades]|uniref:Uncharacterized protein n=1 Tax=Marasmius oreades TaxID=181124 RepID=A0A9P7RSW9_9AGAR|nr:uncharacterized protein E1B28_010762 [Marasmius oreades]KAG7089052.1 hypothetical protein E1B28_010762 [Marasmius oreades]
MSVSQLPEASLICIPTVSSNNETTATPRRRQVMFEVYSCGCVNAVGPELYQHFPIPKRHRHGPTVTD